MSRFVLLAVALGGAPLLGGCGEKPAPGPPDTGSRETVETFYAGLTTSDPPRACATLDPDSKRRVSPDQFANLARAYANNVGFPVEKVFVRSCEEQGETAVAHVSLQSHAGGHSHRYSDGVTLRLRDGRWGVVLPANFGQKVR